VFSKLNKALAVAAALTISASVAQALTVTSVSYGTALLDGLESVANPSATSTVVGSRNRAGVYEGVTGNAVRLYRSPWAQVSASSGKFGISTFTAVRDSTAVYDFGADQIGLSVLWGSTGGRDTLSLFNDGALVAAISPGVANPGSDTISRAGNGAYLVTLTDTVFDALSFSNSRGAFEFANLQVVQAPAPVPLPAGAVLLVTAFGSIGLMRRRKNQRPLSNPVRFN